MKAQIFTDILGTLSGVNYIVGYAFVLLALLLRWTITTSVAVKNDTTTPNTFSWSYWFANNLVAKIKNVLAIVLIVFMVFRFSTDFLGQAFSYTVAVSIGLAFDAYKKRVQDYIAKLNA